LGFSLIAINLQKAKTRPALDLTGAILV